MANPPDRTKRTPEKEDRFIEALRNGSGVVLDACQEIGIGRRTAYEWREADPDFRARWEEAVEESTDRLEKEAYRRAHDGCEKPIYHQGAECGRVKEYSDTLLIFLMKGRRPEKYRDRVQSDVNLKADVKLETSDEFGTRLAAEFDSFARHRGQGGLPGSAETGG